MSSKVIIGVVLLAVFLVGLPLVYRLTQETADKSTGGSGAASVPAAAVKALEDGNSQARLEVLGAILDAAPYPGPYPVTKDLVRAVASALGDRSEDVRFCAAAYLSGIGPAAAPAVPELTKALSDENSNIRMIAVGSLHQIGAAAKSALPELRKLTGVGDEHFRKCVKDAIESIQKAQ